ncbi:MAG: DUF350 domain-containing protein [Anaerolineae bacterium]
MEELLLSLLQLIVALILSVIAAFLALYLFQWFTRRFDEWEALRQNNVAVGIVLGALLVSAALVLRPALAVHTASWDVGRAFFVQALIAQTLQLAVGLVLVVITLGFALYLFSLLTRDIDELEELKKGNLAVASLLAGVALGVGLMMSQAVGQIMVLVSSLVF